MDFNSHISKIILVYIQYLSNDIKKNIGKFVLRDLEDV